MTEYVFENPNKISFITYMTITILMIALVLIVIYFWLLKITPPLVQSEYSLVPGKQGDILYLCGPSSTNPCSFQINSLSDAVNICNKYLNICKKFSVNGNVMSFVAPEGILEDNPNSNIYVYQYGVINQA